MSNFARITLASISLACLTSPATAKTLIDYFQPIPIVGTLTTSGWGIGTSRPRDPDNGIEDIPNWRYWDGKIIKASDGKYHLFCSKWPVSKGLAAWMSDSVSVHATSDNLLGPYKELGLTYTYQNGKGHNTTGLTLVDGTYAVIESAIVPGWIFTSSSLDGPFNYQGSIKWDNNGFNTDAITSNLQIMVGPDNRYWAISSHGYVMDSDNIVGTYKVEAPRIYPIISGMNDADAEESGHLVQRGAFPRHLQLLGISPGLSLMSSTGSRTGRTWASRSIVRRTSSATRTAPSIIGATWSARTCSSKTGTSRTSRSP